MTMRPLGQRGTRSTCKRASLVTARSATHEGPVSKMREIVMQVNELAKRVGVPAHVVRYYTRIGLLTPKRYPKNRYRDYAKSDVYRVRFIRRAKWLGFTLRDVKVILHDADRGVSPCPEVREIIRVRADENRERLDELWRLQARVDEAVALWETLPDKPPDHENLCHLIDAVAQAEGDLT